jgi:histidinol-phosphate aminotransferase
MNSKAYKILIAIILFFIFILILYIYSSKNTIENFTDNNTNIDKLNSIDEKLDTDVESIRNKVIFITSATNGFGSALAEYFSKYDCKLFITGKSKNKVDKMVEKLKLNNNNVFGHHADFSIEKEVRDMFDMAVAHYKKIDILILLPIKISSNRRIKNIKFDTWKNDFIKNMDSVFLLNQLALKHMQKKSIKGRIINCSNYKSKMVDTKSASGSEIIHKDMLERYSLLLADELYDDKISVTTIRIDEDIDPNMLNFDIPITIPKRAEKTIQKIDAISKMFSVNTKKIAPIFLYIIKAPFNEITGKIISTNSFYNNKNLSKFVQPGILDKNKEINIVFSSTKNIKDENTIVLVKQNMIGMSPNIDKFIKSNKFTLKGNNFENKYDGKLIDTLANINNIKKHNLFLFNNENELIKKIIDLFVPYNCEIITHFPSWSNLIIYCKETDRQLKYIFMNSDSKNSTLQPKLNTINNKINSRTKLIYLSSPNTISGQSISPKDFEDLINNTPDNIPIILDQRYLEFSNNKDTLNGIDYLKKRKNLLIIRTLTHFYGIEPLKISYIISNRDINELINNSIIVNDISSFEENLALIALKDEKYNNYIRNQINFEREKLIQKLTSKNIKFYNSEVNFMLIETTYDKSKVEEELEKENIILYQSLDTYNNFWTLPIANKELNKKIFDIITFED